MTNHESPRAALGKMASQAFDEKDLPLFDQAHSERLNYDGTVQNKRVQLKLHWTHVYECPLCGRWRCCIDAKDRQQCIELGHCAYCYATDFRFARRRLRRFTDLTLGGHIARSASHWHGNEPMLERHRQHYRRCEAMRRKLEAAFAAIGEQ